MHAPGRRASFFVFLAALLALSTAGCSASSKYMIKAPRSSIARSPDAATVVFIRPSSYAASMRTTILDANGRFLGDSLPSSYFAVKVPPGEHVFVAWAENTAALRATVEANKIYFVEVSSKMGAWTARMHLLAIGPNSPNWKKIDEWLADSDPYEANEQRGQAYLQSRARDTAERIERAKEALSKYDRAELAERTIVPTDGR